jgi:hypothetical protein
MTAPTRRRPELFAQLLPSGAVALAGEQARRTALLLAGEQARRDSRGRWCLPPGSAPDVDAFAQAARLLLVWSRPARAALELQHHHADEA